MRRRLEGRSAQIAGLRYFNVYGPNEAHKGRMASVAFHAFHQFRAEGRVKLFVGSGGYAEGEQLRDFIHVDDVVAVNLHFLEQRRALGHLQLRHRPRADLQRRRRRGHQHRARHAGLAGRTGGAGAHRVHPVPARSWPPSTRATREADIASLRDAGYGREFLTVQQGVAAYAKELAGQ